MAGKTWVVGGGAGRGGLTIRMGKDFRPGGAPSAPSRPSKQAGPGLRERSLNEVFLRQCTSAYTEKGRAEERQRPKPKEEEEEEQEEEEDYTPLSGTWELDLQNAVSVHDLAGVRRALTGSKRNGGVPALARLLASSDSDGQTPLHLCATGGGKASAEAWSRRPALYSKAPGSSGHPASDGERIIEMLVEARARVDAPNMLGEPPLLAAVRAPAAPGLVRALLRCKADPDRLDALTGETALMEAACSGSSDLCLVLLQSRADPSCRNPQGQTAFDLAVASGNKQVAALPGLEPDAGKAAAAAAEAEKPRQEGDAAALRAAVKACQAGEVRRQLADFSPEGALAALEATDGSGRTLLHLCASAPSGEEAAEVAEALLDARACLQASDAFGRTPLEVAVEAGCSGSSPEDFPMEALETISRLLNAGSPPDYIGLDGAAASTAAGRAICALLEANGVSVDLRLEPESQQQQPQWPEEEDEEEVIDVVPEQPGGEPENVDELMRSSDAEEAEIADAGAAKQAKVEEEEEPSRPSHAPEGQGSEAPEGRGAPEAGVEAAEQPPPQQTQDAEPVSAPSRGSKGGLRGRCEFHGIPLDKLGTFVAAPALKECERLLLLSIEELRKEAEACGLRPKSVKEEAEAKKAVGNASPEEDPERGELILRLKQVFFWKVMPMSVLQAECRSLASEVVESSLGQGSDGRALEREELIEALTVATWGGLTKKESVRDRCKAKGVPVERLADLDQASQLLEQVAELEKKPLSELKNELKRRGFAPEASAEKEALVKALTQVVACEKMPLSSLRDYCKERKLAITGDMRRAEILQFMGNKSWEARYIPVEKLPSYTVGCGLLDQADRLEAKSVEDLRDNCRRRNLPFEALGKKSDLVMCLTSVAVWAQLSNAHLYGECLARGCEPDDLEGIDMRSEKPARKALEEILVRRLLLEIWKGKGIDERIKDDRVALDLFREIGNLESLDEHALKLEYGKLGYPAEAATSKAQIMDRLTKFLVWRCLSLGELKKEAQLMDASVAGLSRFKREEEQCEEMVGRLFEALVRDRWEATGVPVKRLGGMQVAAKLVEEQNSLQGLSEERTRAKYASFGMPEEVGKPESKEELCRRMCLMALWKKLSLKELTKECRELDIPPVTGNITAEELIERLSLGLCLDSWEKEGLPVKRIETIAGAKRVIERARLLKTMTEEELKAEYLKLGLPPGAEDLPNKKELLSRLKKVARWRELSVKELQRECKEEEISIGGIGSKVTDPEHHKELLDRMVLAMCGSSWEKRGVPVRRLGSMEAASKYAKELSRLESMSDEDLKRDYRAIGLPASAGRVPEREEVLSRLKLVTLWSELPIHELRKECQDNSVSLGSLSGKLEESRQEVIERLIMVLFADAWEARGLPLRKLGSIQSAVSLIRETERVNSASEEELQREYSSWNLPSDAPAPEGPRETLRRLKQALLWQHMPLHELRKECQERHVSSHISSEDGREDLGQLIQRLKLAHWGPLHSRPESTGYQQRPGFSIPKGPPPRRPANHWEKPGMGIFADHDPMQAMAKQFRSLELDVGATMDDVKRSYKKLALKYHPDKNLGDAQEEAVKRFREIQESYEVLHKFFEDHPQGLPPRPKAAAGRPAGAAAAPRPGGVPWRGPPGAPGGRGGFFPYSRR